jgi:tRNA(Ser,Leu) C12 N-acetylase TAN1
LFLFVDCSRDKSFDPAELMRLMLTDALETGRVPSRFIIRVQVVHRTCFARQDELLGIAKQVIDSQFTDEKKKQKLRWSAVISKRSHNADMASKDMIPALARLVPREFSVDLAKPDVAVVVQVLNRMAGIGVMWDFDKLLKYNVRKIGEQKIKSRYNEGTSSIKTSQSTDKADNTAANAETADKSSEQEADKTVSDEPQTDKSSDQTADSSAVEQTTDASTTASATE